MSCFFFFQAEDGIRDDLVTGVQTCALPIYLHLDPLLLGRQRIEMQIIGIVGDVKHINLRNAVRPEFYLPMSRFTPGTAGLVVGTSGDAAARVSALRGGGWSVGKALGGDPAAPGGTFLCGCLAPGP